MCFQEEVYVVLCFQEVVYVRDLQEGVNYALRGIECYVYLQELK